MTRGRSGRGAAGFTLTELITALAVFLVICAVGFALLAMAMKRYQSESQVLNSFQEARFGMDQMVRDINDSGYPPANQFQVLPTDPSLYASTPVAWNPGYSTATPCNLTVNCVIPGNYDIILETMVSPLDATPKVNWIRYKLVGTTLYRAIVVKDNSGDPDGATANQLVPYVQNVVNDLSSVPVAQAAQIQATYPGMFPSGNPVAIFDYTCDTLAGPKNCDSSIGASNAPTNVRSVGITLIVMAPFADAQSGLPKLVELHGRGRRINPNQ